MPDYGFGQPRGGLIQTAYVVSSLDAALSHWTGNLKAGPFFLIRGWQGDHPVYRGRPSTATVDIALGFAGHMQIELICPKDDEPSVYKETIDRVGYGFHHSGLASHDLEADIKRFQDRGFELAFRAGVPTGGDVAYMDGGPQLPGMVELIEATTGMDEAFTMMWQASRDWDGSEPVRPL